MDEVIRIAALVATTVTTDAGDVRLTPPAPDTRVVAAWPGEDKFRHVAASWTTMVFSYAAVRAAGQDGGTALAIAVPVTAAAGIGKEIADRRRGDAISVRDLVADAAGAGVAWLLLREVR